MEFPCASNYHKNLGLRCLSTKKIAVVGSKKSGKTTVVEIVVRHLTKLGFMVCTVKHVHHHGFTMDKEGTDTWRHRLAGARACAYFSPQEAGLLVSVEKEPEKLEEALRFLEALKSDIVVIEGFHRLVAKRSDVGKIIVFKDINDLEERVQGTEPPILAYCTFNQALVVNDRGLNHLVLPRDEEKLIKVIDEFVRPQ